MEQEERDEMIEKIVRARDFKFMLTQISEHDRGAWVVTGPQAGNPDLLNYVGRMTQVRKEAGQFGSDTVLLRRVDGRLAAHENQSYVSITDPEHLDWLRSLELEEEDYTVAFTLAGGADPEIGFLIPSKVPDGETTPMREVEEGLKSTIENIAKKL